MKTHYIHKDTNDLFIDANNQEQFKNIISIKIGGNISIDTSAPNLQKIRSDGGISICENTQVNNLREIRSGGNISIDTSAPNLQKIRSGGGISICENTQVNNLREIRSGGGIFIGANAQVNNLREIRSDGGIFIGANAQVNNLREICSGGKLSIFIKLDKKLEQRLWKTHKENKWNLSDQSSEFLLSQKGNIQYWIDNVSFSTNKELFDNIRKDQLTAQEVFAIENTEQRRIAYERMDKIKIKDLSNFTTLDECVDNYGNPEKIVSFNIQGYDQAFVYFNCVCPSTKREYFLETDKTTCKEAKARSFGFEKKIIFESEW